MYTKILAAAAVAATCFGFSAGAATVGGVFEVTAINVTNLNSSESQATDSNYLSALADTLGGANSTSTVSTFTYTGDLDFNLQKGSGDTVSSLFSTGSGVTSGLDAAFGDLTLSKGSINNGTAITTFFLFSLVGDFDAADFTINHDDGVLVYDDGAAIGGFAGPNGERTTEVAGFDGGELDFLYVATNSNPSVFEVDAALTPVPLPAGLPLLLAGLGAFGVVSRRRKAA